MAPNRNTSLKIPIPPPFKSSERIQDCITIASSYELNPRNIEKPWYPAFTQTLSDLVDFPTPIGTLSAAQQHPVSISSLDLVRLGLRHEPDPNETEDDEDEDDGDSTDEEPTEPLQVEDDDNEALRRSKRLRERVKVGTARVSKRKAKKVVIKPAHAEPPENDDDDDFAGPGNVSMSNTNQTTPDSRSQDQEPDCMVVHMQIPKIEASRDKKSPEFAAGQLGSRPIHRCFPVILEAKKAPSRRAHGNGLEEQRRLRLEEAHKQVLAYAATYFALHDDASSVIAVCASGPWWQWLELKRNDVPSVDVFALDAYDEEETEDIREQYEIVLHKKFQKRKLLYLGEGSSDEEWTRLRRFALIPILQRHRPAAASGAQAMPVNDGGKGKGRAVLNSTGEARENGSDNQDDTIDEAPSKSRPTRSTRRANRRDNEEVPEDHAGPSTRRHARKAKTDKGPEEVVGAQPEAGPSRKGKSKKQK